MAGKLRTWTIADCAALALESLTGMGIRTGGGSPSGQGVDLESAFRAVHQPTDKSVVARVGPAAVRRGFALQLTMAYRGPMPRRIGRCHEPGRGRWLARRIR